MLVICWFDERARSIRNFHFVVDVSNSYLLKIKSLTTPFSDTTTREIRSESEKKHDIFLRWAYVSAKDAQDIEDVDELETSRKKIYSIPDYCTKYSNNFSTYCLTGKLASLEGLLATFCSTYMKNCNIKGIVKEDKSTAKTEK